MLVRRMATVTISAPLASMARPVSSKSLYLPVPTSRRERKLRPPTTSKSDGPYVGWFMVLAASDRLHDLEHVVLLQRPRRVGGARNDLAVELDRDPAAGQSQRVDQLGESAVL